MEIPSAIHLITDYFKAHPTHLIPYIVFMFFYPVSDVLLPHLYGKTMDAIKASKPIIPIMIAIVAVLSIIQIVKLIYDKFDSIIFPRLKTYVMTTVYERILKRYENDYQELQTGTILSVLARSPEVISHLFHRLTNRFMPFVLTFTFSLIYFTYFDRALAAGFLIVMLVVLTSVYYGIKKCKCVATNLDGAINAYHEEVEDSLRNLYSIYGAQTQSEEVERIYRVADNFLDGHRKTMQCTIDVRKYTLPVILAFLCIFLMRASNQVKRKLITPGLFISIFVIILYNLGNIFIMNDSIRDIVNDWGTVVCLSELLDGDGPKDIASLFGQTQPPSGPRYKSGIEFNNVTFKYPGSDTPTLNNFNLHIEPGEKVAIVGEIGAGKSTVLKLIMKYINPTSGSIYIDGEDYENITVSQLRQRVGYIPQSPVLFNRTVYENITYGLPKTVTREQIIERLKDLNVYEEFERLQHGLDTVVGKNASKISGGQRQLIWCLRVLFSNPEYLVMDEPTASVNEEVKEKLRAIINRVMQGKTVVMVTHDKFLMGYADRIVTI